MRADACPYRRPFPADFRECVAYKPQQYVGFDLRYHPLEPAWTCAHLRVEPYPRCHLGDMEARRAWVDRVEERRLEALRLLQQDCSETLQPYMGALLVLKGDQLKGQSLAADSTEATMELKSLVDLVLVDLDATLERNMSLLEDAGLGLGTCRDLMRASLDGFVSSRSTLSGPGFPDVQLSVFPDAVRELLPPLPGSEPDGSHPPSPG
jgi:hypothetical protein